MPSRRRTLPGALTIVGNWVPFEDPAGGPNFYKFDDNAHYYLNIDNTGDGKGPTSGTCSTFKTKTRNPNSFLYTKTGSPVDSVGSPNRNVVQTYSVTRIRSRAVTLSRSSRIGKCFPTPPEQRGAEDHSPNYDSGAGWRRSRSLPGGGKGRRASARTRSTSFLGSDLRHGQPDRRRPWATRAVVFDDLAGYAVQSIVLQVPESNVTRNGKSVSGHGATTRWSASGRPPSAAICRCTAMGHRYFVQVSRLGIPLVNEVSSRWARRTASTGPAPRTTQPATATTCSSRCWRRCSTRCSPARTPPRRTAPTSSRRSSRAFPASTRSRGSAGKNATDTLKINLGTPPTANAERLGVLGGDTAGLTRTGGGSPTTWSTSTSRSSPAPCKGNKVPLGDGVNQNDVHFLSAFPYVALRSPARTRMLGMARSSSHRQRERELDAPLVLRHRR